MSNEINEAQGGGDISIVIDAAPEGTATSVGASGMRDTPVLITPHQSHSGEQASSGTFQPQEEHRSDHAAGLDSSEAQRVKMVKEARTWLTLLATVAASVTYQAGLNPPSGFWQMDDSQGHHAGNPVLRDEHWLRYQTFYYFNATAFVTSLGMIVALVSDRFFSRESKVYTLGITAFIDVASLIGAYAAGSTLSNSSTIFIIIITCVAFVAIIYIGEALPNLYFIVLFMTPPLFWLAKKGCLPVTAHMRDRVEMAKKREQEEQDWERRLREPSRANRWTAWLYWCSCARAYKYDIES